MRQWMRWLKGICHPTRLRILLLLNEHGRFCVCELEQILREPQDRISRHLGWLRNAGIVMDMRQGLRVYYELSRDAKAKLKPLLDALAEAMRNEPLIKRDKERSAALAEELKRSGRW